MNIGKEVITGLLAALISIIIIAGSYNLATTEVHTSSAMNLTTVPTQTSIPTHIILVTQRPGEPTYTPTPTHTPTHKPTTNIPASATSTLLQTFCSSPEDWTTIVLQPGDTLEGLAETYNTTTEALKKANCLVGFSLVPGTLFSIPTVQPPTAIPCGPPSDWVYYIVKKGDTLYSIGRAYNVSVTHLQSANCLKSSTIRVGQKLYVPNVIPNFPSSTPVNTKTAQPRPSETPTPIPPSATPTIILPSASSTPKIPTNTPPEPTETQIPTDTPIPPTATFTSTASPEPTTAVPTDWPTSTTPPTITPYPTSTETSPPP